MPIDRNDVITAVSASGTARGNWEQFLTSSLSSYLNWDYCVDDVGYYTRHPFEYTLTRTCNNVEYEREYDSVWSPYDISLGGEPAENKSIETEVIPEEEYFDQIEKILMAK